MAKGITEVISDFKILHPRAYERIYEQGRADAVDELKAMVTCASYDHQFQMISMELLWAILEDLKEQKNGR